METAFALATALLGREDVYGVFRATKRRRAGQWVKEDCIAVAVQQKKPVSELLTESLIPSTVGGIATDVIELNPKLSLYSDTYAVVCGGISIGNSVAEDAGTLGGIFHDDINNVTCGLTNFHVLAAGDTPMVPDTYVVHPAGTDNGNMDATGRIGKSSRYQIDEWGDACIFTLTKPAALSMLESHAVLNGVALPVLNDILEKVGRTTGETAAEVTYLGYVDVSYATQGYGTITMYMAGMTALVGETDAIADSGDSGSVWYDQATKAGKVLHVAHDAELDMAYGCMLSYVLGDLDCSAIDAQDYDIAGTGTMSQSTRVEASRVGTFNLLPGEAAFTAKAFVIQDSATTYATFDEWAISQGWADGETFLTDLEYSSVEEFVASFLTTDDDGEDIQVYADVDEFLAGQTIKTLKDTMSDLGVLYPE